MIRDANANDAAAIADLHLRSWRSAYRGIVDNAYMDGALAGEMTDRWRNVFAGARTHSLILVAEQDGALAGFIAIWPETDSPDTAYIDNLHVDPDRRGGGVGRRLLAEAARRLPQLGFNGAALWVFAENSGAVRFYERLNGRAAARTRKPVGGRLIEGIRMVWGDLDQLARAADT